MQHRDLQPIHGIHAPYSYTFPNEATRLEARLSYKPSDIGRFAEQVDTSPPTWWMLVGLDGQAPLWEPIRTTLETDASNIKTGLVHVNRIVDYRDYGTITTNGVFTINIQEGGKKPASILAKVRVAADVSFVFTNPLTGVSITLVIIATGGDRTIGFPGANVRFVLGGQKTGIILPNNQIDAMNAFFDGTVLNANYGRDYH